MTKAGEACLESLVNGTLTPRGVVAVGFNRYQILRYPPSVNQRLRLSLLN